MDTQDIVSPKKVVRYSDFITSIEVGMKTIVYPIDHPSPYVTNKKPCLTTIVVKLFPDGFETLNTRYIYKPPREF